MNSHNFNFLLILCLKIWITIEHGVNDNDDRDDEHKHFYDYEEKIVKHPSWMYHYCTMMTCSVKIAENEEQGPDTGFEHGNGDEDPQKVGTGKLIIKTKVCDGKCERHLGMTQLST